MATLPRNLLRQRKVESIPFALAAQVLAVRVFAGQTYREIYRQIQRCPVPLLKMAQSELEAVKNSTSSRN